MKILLWGIPCVGNDEIGVLLAKKLKLKYFNHDYIIKEKYDTIDKFNASYPFPYSRFLEKQKIAMEIINSYDNFVMSMSVMYYKRVINRIVKSDSISIEIIDNLESIYDRILFYDENDLVMADSKEYRDAHRSYYMNDVKNDMKMSNKEYKDIPKFNLNGRKFEDVINELVDYVFKLSNLEGVINDKF